MPELVYTPAANADLIDIAAWIESQSASLETAERFLERIMAQCESILL